MQAVLNLVWDKLLPAFRPVPLPADDAARVRLEQRLKALALSTPEGSSSSETASSVSGKTYRFADNDRKLEAVTLVSQDNDIDVTLTVRSGGGDSRILCGRGAWRKGRAAFGSLGDQPVAASGAWTGERTYTAKLCFYETPFVHTVRLTFEDDALRLESEANVGFGPTKQEPLAGRTGRER
jgi:hypothetical protein